MKVLIDQTQSELNHLSIILAQIEQQDYCHTFSELNGSSVGMHIRHILEFFETLLFATDSNINYDKRERKLILEENPLVAFEFVERICAKLNLVDLHSDVQVSSYLKGKEISMKSSMIREIHYNLEHATHHLAMIKVAITKHIPKIELDAKLGFAYSTLQNQKSNILAKQ